MLKEEVMAINESLQDSSLDQFRASDGWLDTWKSAYTIKKRWIVGEAGDVAEETITSWMEGIQELIDKYLSENIWNMDKSGCFLKALPDNRIVEKGKEAKGGQKFKQRFTIAFLSLLPGKRLIRQLSYGRVKSHVVSNI